MAATSRPGRPTPAASAAPHSPTTRSEAEYLRVGWGLYRLAEYPASPREDVIAAWMAAGRDDVVASHESALDLLGLSDAIPEKVHLTVPRSKRYRPRTPGTAVHTTTRSLASGDVPTREGVPVTSPVRSIIDIAEAGGAPPSVKHWNGGWSRGAILWRQPQGAGAESHV